MPGTSCVEGFDGFSAASFWDSHPRGIKGWGASQVQLLNACMHRWGASRAQFFSARVHQAESIPRAAPQCPCAPGSPGRVEQSSSSWTTLELSWDGLPTWEQLPAWEQLPHGTDPPPWFRASLKQRSVFFSSSILAPTRSGSKAFPHRLCITPSRVVLLELEVAGGCPLTR